MFKAVCYILMCMWLLFISDSEAQWQVRGSMGLNFVVMPDVRDYINEVYASSDNQQSTANTAVEFGAEIDYALSPNYHIGIEGAIEFNSYTYVIVGGQYELSYMFIKPTLMGYYVIPGKGYQFRFGAGIGPRFSNVSETKITLTPDDYTSLGVGLAGRFDASTALSEKFYAYIGFDIRYDINGTPETNGSGIMFNGESLNFNSFSAGLKLGVLVTL